jgi:hypothetical protein
LADLKLKRKRRNCSKKRTTLRQKAEEAASLAADLQSLKSRVEELKRPLWEKWFFAAPIVQ